MYPHGHPYPGAAAVPGAAPVGAAFGAAAGTGGFPGVAPPAHGAWGAAAFPLPVPGAYPGPAGMHAMPAVAPGYGVPGPHPYGPMGFFPHAAGGAPPAGGAFAGYPAGPGGIPVPGGAAVAGVPGAPAGAPVGAGPGVGTPGGVYVQGMGMGMPYMMPPGAAAAAAAGGVPAGPTAPIRVTGAQVVVLTRESQQLLLQMTSQWASSHPVALCEYIVLYHFDGDHPQLPPTVKLGTDVQFQLKGDFVVDGDVVAALVDLGSFADLAQGNHSSVPHVVIRHSGAAGLAPTVRARELVKQAARPDLPIKSEVFRGKIGARMRDGSMRWA